MEYKEKQKYVGVIIQGLWIRAQKNIGDYQISLPCHSITEAAMANDIIVFLLAELVSIPTKEEKKKHLKKLEREPPAHMLFNEKIPYPMTQNISRFFSSNRNSHSPLNFSDHTRLNEVMNAEKRDRNVDQLCAKLGPQRRLGMYLALRKEFSNKIKEVHRFLDQKKQLDRRY